MFTSIKSKLIIWFLSVFSILFTGLGFFLYYELSEIVINSVDRHLNDEIRLISGLLNVEEHEMEKELIEIEYGEYKIALSGYYYQIILPNGRIIAHLPSLLTADAPLLAKEESFVPSYRTVAAPGKAPIRIMSQSFKSAIGAITIYTVEPLKESYQLIGSFRNIMLIIFPAVFILFGVGILVITDWSLKTLNVFSRKVGQVTEMSLSERIEERGMDKELMPLANSFNTMLGRLEESFSRQSQFMSDASHELKTPTSVIKSYCDVTLSKERTPAEYQEAIQIIGEMVNKISGIINRILEISRLESKTFSLKLSDVNLMDIMGDVLRLLLPSALSRGIRINLSGQKINIRGDRERLTEVFTNIVDNAIKYNKPDGRVDIEVGSREGCAAITVADTGIGIPEADKERIFDRFYRVDASRSVVAGSGLGLSIVRAIINAHGGKIEMESEIGKGSRFIIFLPENTN